MYTNQIMCLIHVTQSHTVNHDFLKLFCIDQFHTPKDNRVAHRLTCSARRSPLSRAPSAAYIMCKHVITQISSQVMSRLLRSCCVNRSSYFSRTVPAQHTSLACCQYDEALIDTACTVYGLPPAQHLPAHTIELLLLPCKHAGFGITSSVTTAPAAYIERQLYINIYKPSYSVKFDC